MIVECRIIHSESPKKYGETCTDSPYFKGVRHIKDTLIPLITRKNLRSHHELTPNETKIPERMNLVNGTAELTTKKAAGILGNSESAARNTLRSLVNKGYLTEDMNSVPFICSLEQRLPE